MQLNWQLKSKTILSFLFAKTVGFMPLQRAAVHYSLFALQKVSFIDTYN